MTISLTDASWVKTCKCSLVTSQFGLTLSLFFLVKTLSHINFLHIYIFLLLYFYTTVMVLVLVLVLYFLVELMVLPVIVVFS